MSEDNKNYIDLISAVQNEDTNKVACILMSDDINKADNHGNTALTLAVEKNNLAIVKLLLGHSKIRIGENALYKAKLIKNDEIIIAINSAKLLRAVVNGDVSGSRELLKNGSKDNIDINAKDQSGQTALMLAASKGHDLITKEILSNNNIDINAKDQSGQTALMLAASKGHDLITKEILSNNNIDINAKDCFGQTALDTALVNNKIEPATLLANYYIKHKIRYEPRSNKSNSIASAKNIWYLVLTFLLRIFPQGALKYAVAIKDSSYLTWLINKGHQNNITSPEDKKTKSTEILTIAQSKPAKVEPAEVETNKKPTGSKSEENPNLKNI